MKLPDFRASLAEILLSYSKHAGQPYMLLVHPIVWPSENQQPIGP
jgi:hypothetical protein